MSIQKIVSSKKKGLTVEQHEELGRTVWEMRAALVSMEVLLCGALPQTHCVCTKVVTARRAVERLRSDLEEAMFAQHPIEGTLDTYYGRGHRVSETPSEEAIE